MKKLKDWLNENNKTVADMAKDLGLRHCVVRTWVEGVHIPNGRSMSKVVEYTNGEVQPNDFYEVANESN